MRALSNIIVFALFSIAVVASTVLVVTTLTSTSFILEKSIEKHLIAKYPLEVLLNTTGSCELPSSTVTVNTTLLGDLPDVIEEAILVYLNGSIEHIPIRGKNAAFKIPCNTEFILAFRTRSGATLFYNTRADPLHRCIVPAKHVVNSTILLRKCVEPKHSLGFSSLRILEAKKNYWYAIKVGDNPYCIYYQSPSGDYYKIRNVYYWDLDKRYIVFQSPVEGPLYIAPCDYEEASYKNGFYTLSYIVPASIRNSLLKAHAEIEFYSGNTLTILDYTERLESYIEKNGGLRYVKGYIIVPKKFLAINSTDLDETITAINGYEAITSLSATWNVSVLRIKAILLISYFNPRHYYDPWRANIKYSCLYGNCDNQVLEYVVNNILQETMNETYSDIYSKGDVEAVYPLHLMAITDENCGFPFYFPKHMLYKWSRGSIQRGKNSVKIDLQGPRLKKPICALERRAESRLIILINQPIIAPYTSNPKTYNIWGANLVVIDNIEMIPLAATPPPNQNNPK